MKKTALRLVALGTILASAVLAFGLFGRELHGFAQTPGVTATDFYLSSGQEPWGVTFDSLGNVWVAVPGCDPAPTCSNTTAPGKIEEYNPASASWIATYQLPTGYAQPLFLAFDASGNLWFPMPMANSIGTLNLQTKTFQQFAVPTTASGPWDIAIDHNGNIWFTEHYTSNIGEFVPSTKTMKEFSTPTGNSLPYGITVDSSNNIWFTENNAAVAQIAEFTAGGQMREYKMSSSPPANLTPHLITIDPNGNIWWTEGWVGMLGELNIVQAKPGTANGVSQYTYPITCTSCGTHASGISVDGYGQVWFDDSLQGIFGAFPDFGTGSFTTYPAPTPQHPHDGLNVDAQNRIWFTEEFANKLAEAVQNNVPPSPTPRRRQQHHPRRSPGTISLRAVASGNNGSGGSTLTLSAPAGVQSGNVLVAHVVVQTAGNVITPPAGWTLVLRQDSVHGIRRQVTWRWLARQSRAAIRGISAQRVRPRGHRRLHRGEHGHSRGHQLRAVQFGEQQCG